MWFYIFVGFGLFFWGAFLGFVAGLFYDEWRRRRRRDRDRGDAPPPPQVELFITGIKLKETKKS